MAAGRNGAPSGQSVAPSWYNGPQGGRSPFRDGDHAPQFEAAEVCLGPLKDDSNVVLIGMPGVGKSTVGVLLAKALSRHFIDTDVLIQAAEGRRLQDIIDSDGLDAFCRIEERYVLGLRHKGHVIATGGSVVYSPEAMRHLAAHSVIVYLDLPLAKLQKRLRNLDSRGVVMAPGQSIAELYEQRRPLYEKYAQATIQCEGLAHEDVVARIMEVLGR